MRAFMNFEHREKSEEAIKKTWNKFREELAKGTFKYNEVDKAKKTIFLRQYEDLFNQHSGIILKTITLDELKKSPLGRGSIIKDTEAKPIKHDRFVPNKDYITEDNRFSPPGVEWLYLAVGTETDIRQCAIAECRAEEGDNFGFCNFEIDEDYGDCKLVDLTFADALSYGEINEGYINECELFKKEKQQAIKKGFFSKDVANGIRIKEATKKWGVYTYTKMLSDQIFVPLDESDDKSIMYAPFQTMAQYYISLGYDGIVFGSTVCSVGKNVVIFNKEMAKPVGKIDFIEV